MCSEIVSDSKMWRLSSAEMERRWKLVRDHLVENKLDALIVQGYEDKVGGNVKWLTDIPAGYPRTVIFHANDLMTLVDHGPQGHYAKLDGRNVDQPGVVEVFNNWAFQTAHYNSSLNAEAAVVVVKSRGYRRIGLASEGMLPHGFVAGLKTGLEAIEIRDETEFMDLVRARKSAEEIALIRKTAGTQDQVMMKLADFIRPGLRDFEVNAFVDYQMQLCGAERGTYIAKSAPFGKPAPFAYRHFQGRTISKGDYICVLIESNGFGGFWTEVARSFCFGKVPNELADGFELCKAAQAMTANLCVAGASAAEIARAYNRYMVQHGSVPERRLFAHGMGHDMVERPLIREDETMTLDVGCNLAIHPTHPTKSMLTHICDNYLIDLDGKGDFIHSSPKKIFEIE